MRLLQPVSVLLGVQLQFLNTQLSRVQLCYFTVDVLLGFPEQSLEGLGSSLGNLKLVGQQLSLSPQPILLSAFRLELLDYLPLCG